MATQIKGPLLNGLSDEDKSSSSQTYPKLNHVPNRPLISNIVSAHATLSRIPGAESLQGLSEVGFQRQEPLPRVAHHVMHQHRRYRRRITRQNAMLVTNRDDLDVLLGWSQRSRSGHADLPRSPVRTVVHDTLGQGGSRVRPETRRVR